MDYYPVGGVGVDSSIWGRVIGLMAKHHTVVVSREDGFWVGVVAGVSGGATETRRLGDLHGEVVDLLTGVLEVDEADLDLDYD